VKRPRLADEFAILLFWAAIFALAMLLARWGPA